MSPVWLHSKLRIIWSELPIVRLKRMKSRTRRTTWLWTVPPWIALSSILLPWWHHIPGTPWRGVAMLKVALDAISQKRWWSQWDTRAWAEQSILIIKQRSSKLCIIGKSIAIIWWTLITRRIRIWILSCMIYGYCSAVQCDTIHEANGIRCWDLVWKAHKPKGFLFACFFVFWNVDSF